MFSPRSRCVQAGRYTIHVSIHGSGHTPVYSGQMPNVILAPIQSTPTTTCLKVDAVEWAAFVQLMKEEGRSASDRVRQLVRDTVREHQEQRHARS